MALQMPVYRELTAIESKVFMGLSWRQLGAAVLLALVCGGGYAGLVFGLGMDYNAAMYLVFIPGVPPPPGDGCAPRASNPRRTPCTCGATTPKGRSTCSTDPHARPTPPRNRP